MLEIQKSPSVTYRGTYNEGMLPEKPLNPQKQPIPKKALGDRATLVEAAP